MNQTLGALFASLLAQTSPDATATDASAALQVQSVWDFVVKGGPMMIPIVICSFLALTVVVERMIALSRRNVIPPDFLPGLETELKREESDRSKALDYCRSSDSHVARIFAAAIRRLDEPRDLLEKHITEAGAREVRKLRKFLRLLSVIAAIAPLMGLLGTIFGMIEAFQTVAVSGEALGKTELLAAGIYEAMITTAAGLVLAIPVLIAYHAISAKIDTLVCDMDEMTVDFIEEHAAPPPTRALPAQASGKNGEETESQEAPAAVAMRE